MASIYKRSRDRARKNAAWYIGYVDEAGKQRTVKGCPDKTATEAMARKLESDVALRRQGLINPRDESYRDHGARPLSEHLDDWRAALVAKRRTGTHANLYHTRATQVATRSKAGRLTDLQPSAIQSALASLKDSGLSLETVNHHRAAFRAFVRWAHADGRLRDDPMAGVTGYNAKEDVRHQRRDLTEEELAHVIRAAEAGPVAFLMPGPMRAMAYRLAAGTGFRANEIRTLTPECFRLEGPGPCITLRPKNEKNRKGTEQPISASLARDLRDWLRGAAPGVAVLPLHHETAKAMRRDLEAAWIAYHTDEGIADFHSLRGFYISALIRSGSSIKTVQTLARHSNPSLTLARYARTNLHDVGGAVESLPDLSRPPPTSEPMARTGTESGSDLPVRGSEWPVNGGREEAVSVGFRRDGIGADEEPGEPQTLALGGVGRPLTATGGQETERGGLSYGSVPTHLTRPTANPSRCTSP